MKKDKFGCIQVPELKKAHFVRFESGDISLVLKKWKLTDPGFILSFSGDGRTGDDEFVLKNLQSNLEYLVRRTGAWITSTATGSDGKFVESIVNTVESSSDFCPIVVGVFPSSLLDSISKRNNTSCTISDYFTHFIFVEGDDDVNKVLNDLNRHISTTTTGPDNYKVPVVRIVLETRKDFSLILIDDDIPTIVVDYASNEEEFKQHAKTYPDLHLVEKNKSDYMLDIFRLLAKRKLDFLRLAIVFNLDQEETKQYFEKCNLMENKDHLSEMIAFCFELENFTRAFDLMSGEDDKDILEKVVPASYRRLNIPGSENVKNIEDVDKMLKKHTNLDVSFIRRDEIKKWVWSVYLFILSIIANKFDPEEKLLQNIEDVLSLIFWVPGMLGRNIHYERRKEKQKELEIHKEKYDKIAVSILDHCFKETPTKTNQMILRKRTILEGKSLLSLAEENKTIVNHPAFQETINGIWHGELKSMDNRNTFWKIAVCLACPLLAFVLLVFDTDMHSYDVCRKTRVQIGTTNKKSLLRSVVMTAWHFLKCPFVIYLYDAFANGVFLIVFAHGLMFEMTSNIRLIDYVLYVWVVSLFAEEVRQIVIRKHTYKNNSWNLIDIIAILAFCAGEWLRCASCCFDAGRIILAFDFILFCARVLHFFSSLEHIGPQIIMVGKMIQDLGHFMIILFVVIVAYGVATQSIMYPNSSPSWETAIQTLRIPFWNIFGELGLEQLEDAAGCTTNETIWKNEDVPKCPSDLSNYFVPVMLGVYMIIVQVLLVNLLIAMFNYTFTEVKEEANTHWCHLRFKLVLEYHDRPWLCQPFSVFFNIWYLLKFIRTIVFRKTVCVEYQSRLSINFPRNVSKALDVWERKMTKDISSQGGFTTDAQTQHRNTFSEFRRIASAKK